MSASEHKKSVNGLYILKAICALFVVIIHIPILWKEYMSPIVRIAVPCFFMVSGYFLYRNNRVIELSILKRWFIKIVVFTVYLVLFYSCLLGNLDFSIQKFVFSVFSAGAVSGPLWYMSALWQAFLCMYIIRFVCGERGMCLTPLLLPVFLCMRSFNLLPDCDYAPSLYNVVFNAIPYIGLGYLVSKYKDSIKNVRKYCIFYLMFLAVNYILSCNSGYSLDGIVCSFVTSLCAIFFFIVFSKFEYKSDSCIVYVGKNCSADIYYYHSFVSMVVGYLNFHIFHMEIDSVYAILVFIACIIFSVLLRACLRIFRNRVKNVLHS